MSFWSGIKHALNSSLGKDNFRPLDKKLQMAIYESKENVLIHKEVNDFLDWNLFLKVKFKTGLRIKERLFIRVFVSWDKATAVSQGDRLYAKVYVGDDASGNLLVSNHIKIGGSSAGSVNGVITLPASYMSEAENKEIILVFGSTVGNITLSDEVRLDSIEILGEILPDSFLDFIKIEKDE